MSSIILRTLDLNFDADMRDFDRHIEHSLLKASPISLRLDPKSCLLNP